MEKIFDYVTFSKNIFEPNKQQRCNLLSNCLLLLSTELEKIPYGTSTHVSEPWKYRMAVSLKHLPHTPTPMHGYQMFASLQGNLSQWYTADGVVLMELFNTQNTLQLYVMQCKVS